MNEADWKPTACILCECNCGIEVQLGAAEPDDGAVHFVKIRGDKRHPISQGYACEKAQRLDHYQNGPDRILLPQRRRVDGTYETIDWDTAIREVAEGFARVRDEHGGERIFYYGGGGQGNHLPGAYATATRRALQTRHRSNALAQEKTGEFWVSERMLGTQMRGDFEHCDVAMFLGKNPWFSHGLARARVVLKEIAQDPARTMIVVDPRRTKTAELADIHLQVRPGTDAWLLSAMVGILLEEGLIDEAFVSDKTVGFETVREIFSAVDVAAYCAHAGVPEDLVRQAARAIGKAERFSSYEDLGVQMNKHSTVVSYLHRLLWLLTGHVARPGTRYTPSVLQPMVDGREKGTSPVTGARLVGGLVPCNAIPDEILTDHPDRFRAMLVESANPAHSLADSPRFREALRALEFVVVIDVAMTETAREAHYVLPASTQFEKAEATFFNFEFPKNAFQLRGRLIDPPEGPLPEAEMHARLVEQLGVLDGAPIEQLRAAASEGIVAYAAAFMEHVAMNPALLPFAPALLYRTLGPTLPKDKAEGAVLLGLAFRVAMKGPEALARAGFTGSPLEVAVALFEAMLNSPSGVVFGESTWEEVAARVGSKERPIELALDDLLEDVRGLDTGPRPGDVEFPFVLSAGERRAFTANTIFRGTGWRKKDSEGALRIHPEDAAELGLTTGQAASVSTRRGSVIVSVEVSDAMQRGHVSLPNGMGLGASGEVGGGVATNELTESGARDPYVGTPHHKYVPARIERAEVA